MLHSECVSRHHRRVSPAFALMAIAVGSFLTPRPANAVTAATYRKLADEAVSAHKYSEAAHYYRLESAIRHRLGDDGAAKVEEMKAERWSTEIEIYAAAPIKPSDAKSLYSGAKFEPIYGCYLSAYVEGDGRLDRERAPSFDEGVARRARTLGQLLNKAVSVTWTYTEYGSPYPLAWAKEASTLGIAPQIAWEPNDGLDKVVDDEYLEQFARDAAATEGPVFLRFASEMNGQWTNYSDNPVLYREKFRLVHDVMARVAPNVAMIWCPNYMPEANIQDYYPGDAFVDWVGVNFYSVLHHNNDLGRPADSENPTSLLKGVYAMYSARKPIAICEYSASHREKLDMDRDRSEVASAKFTQLLAALPRQFPRVKMIGIYDCDNLSTVKMNPARKLNNYCVTDSSQVLDAVARGVDTTYFLPRVASVDSDEQGELPERIAPLASGLSVSGILHLSASVKSYDDHPIVSYLVDGSRVKKIRGPGDYSFDLDPSSLASGKHTVKLVVYDSHGIQAGSRTVTFVKSRSGLDP